MATAATLNAASPWRWQAEMRRRTKVIRGLPRDLCPESKVTPQLAANPALGLAPVVSGIDECRVLFTHQRHGDEGEKMVTDLIKRGPAVGIVLLLATQRPDAKSLPTGISANAGTRFCLRVMGQVENDIVLGTSMWRNGIRAAQFTTADKGLGCGQDARHGQPGGSPRPDEATITPPLGPQSPAAGESPDPPAAASCFADRYGRYALTACHAEQPEHAAPGQVPLTVRRVWPVSSR